MGSRLVCLRIGLAALLATTEPAAAVAQTVQPDAAVAGAWAGWLDVGGNYQPLAASFTPNGTPPGTITNLLTGASRPLAALTFDGMRMKAALADPRFPVLTGTIEGNTISGVAEATGGRTGAFRLIRTAAVDQASFNRYVGAYRFATVDFSSSIRCPNHDRYSCTRSIQRQDGCGDSIPRLRRSSSPVPRCWCPSLSNRRSASRRMETSLRPSDAAWRGGVPNGPNALIFDERTCVFGMAT